MKKVITREQWIKTPKDYKSMIDGEPYILEYDRHVGTCLVPVIIKEDN